VLSRLHHVLWWCCLVLGSLQQLLGASLLLLLLLQAGICMVGMSSVLSGEGSSTHKVSTDEMLMGMGLIVLSQVQPGWQLLLLLVLPSPHQLLFLLRLASSGAL